MILLRQEREKKGISQPELARMSGVSQQAISLIESGERKNPGIETMSALAAALGCGLGDLCVPEKKKSDNVDGFEEGQACTRD